VAVNLTATIAASLRWKAFLFDVSTAFLSGKPTAREVYVRGPRDGLPATSTTARVEPMQLMRILKSIYGLAEAPRLWYMRARELLEAAGYCELQACRSTFVLLDKGTGLTESICCLHVDDGFLVGNMQSSLFLEAKKTIDEVFTIKEWIDLQVQSHDYLGEATTQHHDFSITKDMTAYIMKIDAIPTRRDDDDSRALTAAEHTALRSLIMKLAWPARKVLSQLAYSVSKAAQSLEGSTVADVKSANGLLKWAKAEAEAGRARQHFKAIDLSQPCIVTYFDASFGKEVGSKSQAGFFSLATDERVINTVTSCNNLEHNSTKIGRVVRSTMAAESAAMSNAIDRHLFCRLLFQSLMYGNHDVSGDWRRGLVVKGFMVTDARSLYDHLHATGSMPSERSVMIDLLSAKDMVEAGIIQLRWCPTQHQLSDHLTKQMKCELLKQFMTTGLVQLTQTTEQQEHEQHKASLRKGQRQRRKTKMKATVSSPQAPLSTPVLYMF
jgi:hypothetical protein